MKFQHPRCIGFKVGIFWIRTIDTLSRCRIFFYSCLVLHGAEIFDVHLAKRALECMQMLNA